MLHTTLLLLHISGATVGLLAGFGAMAFRKGSNWHGASGAVFFVSMLLMSSSGAYIAAFTKPNRANLVVALLTLYLVATAWLTAKRREGGTGLFDRGASLCILLVGITGIAAGIEAAGNPRGMKDGMPAPIYFIFGSIALICAVSDVRMIRRGGVTGTPRIVRHLWRMCGALLIATLSFYPGQARLFPLWLRETNLLFIPVVLLLGGMFWSRARLSRGKRLKRDVVITTSPGPPIVGRLEGARAPAHH